MTLRAPLDVRFWRYVQPSSGDDCWEWKGSLGTTGYGQINVNKRPMKAHRASWVVHFGPIPNKLCVLHRCDNPKCVNPSHLFLGTMKDNVDDARSKGRLRGGSLPGESNPYAKLTLDEVRDIRARHKNGEAIRAIARTVRVGRSAVAQIVHGKRWTFDGAIIESETA